MTVRRPDAIFEIICFSALICSIQLIGTYFRYISFKDELSPFAQGRLWRRFMGLTFLTLPAYAALFSCTGLTVQPYKALLILGWLPYQLLLMHALPGRLLQHTLVWGMAALWSFICHSLSSIVDAAFLMEQPEKVVLEAHATLFHLWFLLFFLPTRHYFARILPAYSFFEGRWLRCYTALLPTVMLSGFLVLIADERLWHSWDERLARLVMPIAFFVSYHYLLGVSRLAYQEEKLSQRAALKEQEISYLQEEKFRAAAGRVTARKQRKNLLSTYLQLRQLIQEDKIDEALSLISRQDQQLAASAVHTYTASPLLNAAISIYLQQADDMGLQVSQKVNLPKNLQTEEDDLAVLLSNLLENALRAAREDGGQGELSFVLQHKGNECVLRISNPSRQKLVLGADGLPKTSRHGHGLGMLSLKNFLQKYSGCAIFKEEAGQVKLLIYWEDKKC